MADPFAGFEDKGPATPGAAQQADPFSKFEDRGPNSKPRLSVSESRSALAGVLDTASAGFWDELYGLSEASGLPGWLGGLRAPVGAGRLAVEKYRGDKNLTNLVTGDSRGPVERKYEEARDLVRKVRGQAEEDNPKSYLAGQLGGAVITPGLSAAKGATVGVRAARAAATGGLQGALYGAGSSDSDLAGRATGALEGGAVGAVTGGLASPVSDIAGYGLKKGGEFAKSAWDTLRAELNEKAGQRIVENEASKRIAASLDSDVAAKGFAFNPAEIEAANRAGIPRALADIGDERTLALARSSANQSPEARSALTTLAQDRYAGQSTRAAGYIKNLTGGADAAGDLETIRTQARAANKPRYAQAYAEGNRPVWSNELERISSAPAVQEAMKTALVSGKNRAVGEGFGGFNPGVMVTPDGRIQFGKSPLTGGTTYPNLQYWDYVQRDLRDAADSVRGKEPDKAKFLGDLHKQLTNELDKLVPSFQTARQGAWKAFQAEDALEAGKNFVHARGQNGDYAAILRKIEKQNPADKELFARGFASELSDRILELRDGQNVINQSFLTSPAAKQRIAMALGSDRSAQLETYLRAEHLSDRLRQALGNSTTARQLAEMGLAGAGTLALGHGAIEGEWDTKHALTAALLFGAAYGRHQMGVLDKSVARRVGEMLASNDPEVLRQGVKIAAKSRTISAALRTAGNRVSGALGGRVTPTAAAIPVVGDGGGQ